MERVKGVPKGVTWQITGVHSGKRVLGTEAMSVDYNGPREFACTKLVHFTENTVAASIGLSDTDEPFCFMPKLWCANETSPLNLSWWSPCPPDNWDRGSNPFLSPAVGGPPLCGPVGFVAPWKDLLKRYAEARRETASKVSSSAIEIRNLGTYLYIREIMFAVLVCIEGDITDNCFPVIKPEDKTEAISFPSRSYDDFIWKVYSTVSCNTTWDHLTFAFYCPNANFNIQPEIFSIKDQVADKYRPKSRDISGQRTENEMNPCTETITSLEEKIQRAKDALH